MPILRQGLNPNALPVPLIVTAIPILLTYARGVTPDRRDCRCTSLPLKPPPLLLPAADPPRCNMDTSLRGNPSARVVAINPREHYSLVALAYDRPRSPTPKRSLAHPPIFRVLRRLFRGTHAALYSLIYSNIHLRLSPPALRSQLHFPHHLPKLTPQPVSTRQKQHKSFVVSPPVAVLDFVRAGGRVSPPSSWHRAQSCAAAQCPVRTNGKPSE